MADPTYRLQKDLFVGIVTSLLFHSDTILLAGHGPFFKVFHIPTAKLLHTSLVLDSNRIHRMVLVPELSVEHRDGTDYEHRTVIVYGAKILQVLTVTVAIETGFFHLPRVSIVFGLCLGPLKDWIMDARWIYEDDAMDGRIQQHTSSCKPIEVAIAFAHNFVEIWDLRQQTPVCTYSIQCEERCMLYSARFHGRTRSNLVLASGTVFNQVLIWDATSPNEHGGESVVRRRLIGHEGVIFGIRFNEEGKMIASVSDDRTIRVWKLDEDDRPLVIFGHISRVWDCHFVGNYLISISEDTTCRVWQNTLMDSMESEDTDDIQCIACWEGHVGKNVWSVAISPDHRVVATGGQDSGIRLWSLQSVMRNKISKESDLVRVDLPPFSVYRSASPTLPKESIRNFVLIDMDKAVIVTNYGYFLKYDQTAATWTTLYHNDAFVSYTMMGQSPCGQVVVCGSIRGDLVVLSSDDTFKPMHLALHKDKIHTLFVNASEDPNVLYIITRAVDTEMFFNRFDITNPLQPSFQTLYQLQIPPHRTTILSVAISESRKILICGTRESALLIYRIPSLSLLASATTPPPELPPTMKLRCTHGRQSVTSIVIRDSVMEGTNEPALMVWTSGRDGGFVQYRVRGFDCDDNVGGHVMVEKDVEEVTEVTEGKGSTVDGDGNDSESDEKDEEKGGAEKEVNNIIDRGLFVEKVHRSKITKGWLEQVKFIDNELLLIGFYRKSMFVYNETKNYEMLSVACGGAHRHWSFLTADSKLSNASFMFIRKESIYVYHRHASANAEGFEDPKLQENYHGREVRSIRFLKTLPHLHTPNQAEPIIIITGSEDTLLRLHQYIPGKIEAKLRQLCSIRKHTSVIRSIEWSQGIEKLLFTSGASELMRCWKVEVRLAQDEPLSDEIATPAPPLLNLSCLEWAACPYVSDAYETRIMDTTVYSLDPINGLHLITAVYSDSVVRLWLFDEKTREFVLAADGNFHGKCILQVKHAIVKGDNGDEGIMIFTSATDGRIAIWDITLVVESFLQSYQSGGPKIPHLQLTPPVYHYQAHLSGVNCLDVFLGQDGKYLVASGGDDNALAVAMLDVSWDKPSNGAGRSLAVVSYGDVYKVPSAHASSLQGLHLLGETAILTTATDQRLNLWAITTTSQRVALSLMDSRIVDVPDPSAMDVQVFGTKVHVAITGIGLETFQLDTSFS